MNFFNKTIVAILPLLPKSIVKIFSKKYVAGISDDKALDVIGKLNCTNMMFQDLVKDYFRTPLGEGNPTEGSGPIQNPEWKSNPPDSNGAFLNKKVCEM